MEALKENDTFQLVKRPQSQSVIGGRWVYARKMLNDQNIFKARYVAKGYSQVHGVNYHETFSPTARLTSIRVLMNLAATEKLKVHQMDVKSAYLNSKIDCEVFVEQPQGFRILNSDGKPLVLKLNRSLYGLKQSGRMWNSLLHSFLVGESFVRSDADNCVYTKHTESSKLIIIVWVDDIIIASSDSDDMDRIKQSLSRRFRMKDFGCIKSFLGIDFEFVGQDVKMNQKKYTETILQRFKMDDCNPKQIPCDMNTAKLEFDDDSEMLPDSKPYREIVGSLIYLMTCTRPDICYLVTKLSQHLDKPRVSHFNLAKFVLKYLKGTKETCLTFRGDTDISLTSFSDSDWGSSIDRKSITGFCFNLSSNSSFVSWKSKKQQTIALSTCEAEYMAATQAIQEGLFVRQLISDMLKCEPMPVNLFVDNKGAIDLAKNPVHHHRTKHIDVKYHFIRHHVNEGTVLIHHIPSAENPSDLFTKPSTKIRIEKFFK